MDVLNEIDSMVIVKNGFNITFISTLERNLILNRFSVDTYINVT